MAAVTYEDAKRALHIEHGQSRNPPNWRIEITCLRDKIAVLYLGWEILSISRRSSSINALLARALVITAINPIAPPRPKSARVVDHLLPQPIAEEVAPHMRGSLTITKYVVSHLEYRCGINAYTHWCCIWDPKNGWRAILEGEPIEYLSYRGDYSYDTMRAWFEENF